ncbi:PREDICTED: uncharacterized protein LOC109183817 [Ipomoea nil]|uniref:uncharacterized protein LOC109183817 n=1 Tax=Ipomoea nil TaxID=35883 RepID=UPI0009019615|nr:PREDICTED: uncharacterized protein LOC109183817 [Ipomoea nil]
MAQEYMDLACSECRSILKHIDLGRFTIPCFIGGRMIKRSLSDLGASANVIPLSLCKKLNLEEPKPIKLTLQFVDQSTTRPIGILEDVPVRVDKYFVPCDFILIDAPENPDTPIILGRPFLATTRALIDARKGTMIFDFGEENVEFNVINEPKSTGVEDCSMVNSKPLDMVLEHEMWKNFFGHGFTIDDLPD